MNGIFTLRFADDQVINSKSKNDLEKMTVKIKKSNERWGLPHERSKTKYPCIGKYETDLNLINNIGIERYKRYVKLGVKINREGRYS